MRPSLPAGSVTVDTVFHVISAAPPSRTERSARDRQIQARVDVLDDASSGAGAAAGSVDTPVRFAHAGTDYTANAAWSTLTPGSKEERTAETALREGDASTLNVYVAGRAAG